MSKAEHVNSPPSRREVLKLFGLIFLVTEFPFLRPSPSPEKDDRTSVVVVRSGDTISRILAFYGIQFNPAKIKTLNPQIVNLDQIRQNQSLVIPVTKEQINHPYKRIFFPGLNHQNYRTSIIPALTDDQIPKYDAWSDSNFPYVFFGHTQDNVPQQGTFTYIRQMNLGNKIYFSRTWLGEGNTDWCHGTVTQTINTTTETQNSSIFSTMASTAV